MKKIFLVALVLFLSACAVKEPTPESGSGMDYALGSRLDVNTTVYTLTVEVIADLKSDKTLNAEGSGSMYAGQYGGYGTSSFSMWQEGKGFLRGKILSISPSTDLAKEGDAVILKTEDRKIIAVLPGDQIELKCRIQAEALSAVRPSEEYTKDKEVYEFDYCRMTSPVIGEAE